MERERQREWEESQKETAGRKVDGLGGGIGGKWDVNRKFPYSVMFGDMDMNAWRKLVEMRRRCADSLM